jgi:putative RNA 2'-phosphotransferase
MMSSIRSSGRGGPWSHVSAAVVLHVVDHGTKPRYEIDADRIRARYGHSLPDRLDLPTARPPVELFHGTSPAASELIRDAGLLPMNRQFVHPAEGQEDARRIGRRKSETLVVIDGAGADNAGVVFHQAHDGLWLSPAIPAPFVTLSPLDS